MSEQKNDFAPTINPSESTVQDMFGQILQQRIQSGVVEKKITESVDKLIESSIERALESYGTIGKEIKAAVENAITPNLEDLGKFPQYQKFIIGAIQGRVNQFHDERLQAVIDKELDEIFQEMPEEITLSWVLENVIKQFESDNDDERDESNISLHIEDDGRWQYIYISKKENARQWECEHKISCREGEVFSVKIDGSEGKPLHLGAMYNFEKILFNLYAMKGKLILDKGSNPSDYDTYVEPKYYD